MHYLKLLSSSFGMFNAVTEYFYMQKSQCEFAALGEW